MHKFVVIQGSCGNPYEVAKAEQSANSMVQQGYVMDHVPALFVVAANSRRVGQREESAFERR